MLCGAYYYPWYSGPWLRRTVRRADPPVLGQYNNKIYSDELAQHFRWMREYGIDFASVSWEPHGAGYEHVMDVAEEEGVKLTVLYESLCRASGKFGRIVEADFPRILNDMRMLAADLHDPCWLRIDGRPVVMLYVSRNYYEKPEVIMPEIRKVLGQDVFLVGDEIFWGSADPARCSLFDAVTSYNWYQPGRFSGEGKDACDSFVANVESFLDGREIPVPYWPVAMPGYDDRGVRPQKQHPPIPREDGHLFKETLAAARKRTQGAFMITSWNEFFEDTQIEPTNKYGNLYLEMLR